MRTISIRVLAGGLAVALAAAGCQSRSSHGSTVRPKTPASEEGPMASVSTTVAGVTVYSKGDAWPADVAIREEITPLQVALVNASDRPVRIEYRNFTLTTPGGTRLRALPPYEIEGTAEAPATVVDYEPQVYPDFAYTGFRVYPHYRAVYPGITVWTPPHRHDIDYYQTTYTVWRSVGLPTASMLRRALPEGVLAPGGAISGYLYFQKLPVTTSEAMFHVELVNARTDERFATVSLAMEAGEVG